MRKALLTIFAVLFVSSFVMAQPWVRVTDIPLFEGEAGLGQVIAGVDLDEDGRPEIYAPNNNWADGDGEMVPKLFKYEYNPDTETWDLVWHAVLNLPAQNTWPPMAVADLDKDGKKEIVWAPINYLISGNSNPKRIVIFEVAGDGSDVMGVPDGDNFLPNAARALIQIADTDLRPYVIKIADIDGDGTDEIVYSDRSTNYDYGVISIDNIPDNGDGSENWTFEAMTLSTSLAYHGYLDMTVKGNDIYLLNFDGEITCITAEGGGYVEYPITGLGLTMGSWMSLTTVDINNDGTEEMIYGDWDSPKVYLLQGDGANLTVTEIADFTDVMSADGRIYGCAFGDADLDGNIEFYFGSRDADPYAAILQLRYNGGAIDNPESYTPNLIDSGYKEGGRWMYVALGQIDKDPLLELVYTEGTGFDVPIIVLDQTGVVPVELSAFKADVVDGAVQLSWATATETNNQGFEVERSTDNVNFTSLGFVEGMGTTSEAKAYAYTDNNVATGTYYYRLKQVDLDGTFTFSDVVEVEVLTVNSFALDQNYPNPFNPATTVSFQLPQDAQVTLTIYNSLGQIVATLVDGEMKAAGTYNVSFDGSNLASGTYIYQLTAGDFVATKKMILMK